MKKREHGDNFMRITHGIQREIFGGNYTPDFYENDSNEIKNPTINKIEQSYDYIIGYRKNKPAKEAGSYELRYSVIMPAIYKDKLSYIDRRVHDAICNLYLEGYQFITLYEVFSYLYPDNARNKQRIEEIKHSIRKLNCTIVEFDISEEAKAYKWNKYFKGLKDEGRLIDLRRRSWDDITEEFKKDFPKFPNPPKFVLWIIAPPIMLSIAEKNISQVQYIPRKLFLERDYKKISRNRINEEIFEVVLDRLPLMHKNKHKGLCFIYENLAETLKLNKWRKKELPDRFKLIIEWFKECELIDRYVEFDAENNAIDKDNKNKPRKIILYGEDKIKEIEASKKVDEKSFSR